MEALCYSRLTASRSHHRFILLAFAPGSIVALFHGQLIKMHAKPMLMQQLRCCFNQLELYRVLAFGAAWKILSAQERNFMRNSMGFMNHAVNSALRNRLASVEDGFISRHARANFTKKQTVVRQLVPRGTCALIS